MKDKKEQVIQWTFPYWGPLLFKSKIPLNKIKYFLKKAVNKQRYNTKLAGHIQKEFVYPAEILQKELYPYFKAYLVAATKFYDKQELKNHVLSINQVAWINYMKAGEFNPPHFHTGGDLSFVVYLQIPKALEREHKAYKGTACGPGGIEFINETQRDRGYNVNSVTYFPEAGDMFIFPANLYHCVYPFQCKGERISISANLKWLENPPMEHRT